MASDRGEFFRRKLAHINEHIGFERARTARRLDLQQQLYLWLAMCNVQHSTRYSDMVLMIDARWIIVMGNDDRRLVFPNPLLDLHDETATILKVAIGQRSAEQFKPHNGAGPLSFLDAIGRCRVWQPGDPIRDDPDQHSVALGFQNT
jgi:hypothetical protein